MPDNGVLSLAHLRDTGGGQLRKILHPSGMLLSAGTVVWCRLRSTTGSCASMPPAPDPRFPFLELRELSLNSQEKNQSSSRFGITRLLRCAKTERKAARLAEMRLEGVSRLPG